MHCMLKDSDHMMPRNIKIKHSHTVDQLEPGKGIIFKTPKHYTCNNLFKKSSSYGTQGEDIFSTFFAGQVAL